MSHSGRVSSGVGYQVTQTTYQKVFGDKNTNATFSPGLQLETVAYHVRNCLFTLKAAKCVWRPGWRASPRPTAGAHSAAPDQRLLNAAARVVSNTGKFDRGLTHLLHSELHWLDVPQRILHKLGVTVHRCLQGKAPQYFVNCCHPSDVASRQRLRSSSRHHLVVPGHCRSTLGRRAFSVVGPMAWNALPTTSETRRSVPTISGRR